VSDRGKIRRSAVISTFGPGAVVDFRSAGGAVSAVVAGLDEWEGRASGSFGASCLRVHEPRLERALNVSHFVIPPVAAESNVEENRPETRPIPAVRFPQYLQCPRCNRIAPVGKWRDEPGKIYRYCPKCTHESPGGKKVFVYPVRFIMACENGHLDEFPWDDWVEHKSDCNYKQGGFLKLESKYPGISGLILSCPECGVYRSMDGIFSAGKMQKHRCRGKRPWLSGVDEVCDRTPRVIQRGASNIYFPVTGSALSIPPWSDRLQQALGYYWRPILYTEPSNREFFIKNILHRELAPILRDLQLTPDDLVTIINQRVKRYSGDEILDLRGAEYRQFTSGVDNECNGDHEFEIRNEEVPEFLEPYFARIVRAVRLREIRALKGFTRVLPPGGDINDTNIAPISLEKKDWLPAIEVRGEGIFLEINAEPLRTWERNTEVMDRANSINRGWQDEWQSRYQKGTPFSITPRFLLAHTFSHALMRQLTLECGYSGASLNERLYIRDETPEMCGVLIYTATSDSDGTLGGLQRQGTTERIARTIAGAIRSMEWCSSDPLCIEGMTAARESHSKAACHACCLAPETSCEHFNKFLDRGVLVGTPENPDIGFFTSLLRED